MFILGAVAGVIIGLLLAIIVFLSVKKYQVPIERTIKQLENKTKEKGEIFVESEQDEELKAFLDGLPSERL